MQSEDNIKKEILARSKNIAIIGLSDNPERPSYRVAKYLKEQGYRIIPVNPNLQEWWGEKSYSSLSEIPFSIDIADVFRQSKEIPGIVREALDKKIPVLWLQLDITCPSALEKEAYENGLTIIKNCCIMMEHKRLINMDS